MASTSNPAKAARVKLEEIRRRRTVAENALKSVKLAQDRSVEAALEAGLDVTTVARTLGVSRFTIYHRRKSHD